MYAFDGSGNDRGALDLFDGTDAAVEKNISIRRSDRHVRRIYATGHAKRIADGRLKRCSRGVIGLHLRLDTAKCRCLENHDSISSKALFRQKRRRRRDGSTEYEKRAYHFT
jgi:hypothetical protein